MKYKDSSFRGVDRQFVVFAFNEEVRGKILEQLGAESPSAGAPDAAQESAGAADTNTAALIAAFQTADSFLGYGYIDAENGRLSLVVLAPAQRMEEGVAIQQMLQDASVIIRVEDLTEEDYFDIGGTEEADKQLRAQFGPIVEEIDAKNDESEDVKRARGMRFLDGLRHETRPDNVKVRIGKPGIAPETVWMRIIGVGEHDFTGVLLEEPLDDFGVHRGDTFTFGLQQKPRDAVDNSDGANGAADGGHTVDELFAARFFKITKAESLNGVLLQRARDAYKDDPSVDTWGRFLDVLDNCYVWIPCNASYAEAPAADDTIQLTADILTNGDVYFFPVFSSPVEMGEDYAKDFSLIEKPFREAIRMAETSEAKLNGIIFNAFSDKIIINTELFEFLKEMPDLVEQEG